MDEVTVVHDVCARYAVKRAEVVLLFRNLGGTAIISSHDVHCMSWDFLILGLML